MFCQVHSSDSGYIGSGSTDYGNTVLVTDPGSIWSNSVNLYIGYSSAGNSLTLSNSAALYVSSQFNIHNGSTFTASTGNIGGGFTGAVSNYVNIGVSWLLNGTVFSASSLSNAGTVSVVDSSLHLGNATNGVNLGVLTLSNSSLILSNYTLVNYGTINAVYGNIALGTNSLIVNEGTLLTSNNIPVITSISVTGTNVVVAFHTGMGGSYGVEYTDDLTSGNWTTVADGLTGTNGVLTVVDTGAAILTQRFYHALLHLP
jgi:T5SS/PEP-CTERM-associated repeat protein